MAHNILENVSKVTCIGFLIFQGALLDAYLVILNGKLWALWAFADAIVICLWIVSLVLAAHNFKKKKRKLEEERKKLDVDLVDGLEPEEYPDELKYAFVAWIAYVVFLIPRVGLLFHQAKKLDEQDVLGPNFLKVAVSCSPIIFLFLVNGHHDADPHSGRKYYVEKLAGTVALDLFDSIDLLDFLDETEIEEKVPSGYRHAMLIFACVIFVLPVFALYELKVNAFNGRVPSFSFKLAYVASFAFLVNGPNLLIRSLLWHLYDIDVSVLIMKNVLCILLGILDICDYFGENQPKKCESCGDWFQRAYLNNHTRKCKQTDVTKCLKVVTYNEVEMEPLDEA